MKKVNYEDLAASKIYLEVLISGEMNAAVKSGDIGIAVFSAGQLAMLERFWERILFMVRDKRDG